MTTYLIQRKDLFWQWITVLELSGDYNNDDASNAFHNYIKVNDRASCCTFRLLKVETIESVRD